MDPFRVLGVPPGASSDDVSAAYRRLAKRWHPDRGGGPGAQQQMARINAAYDLLREQLVEAAQGGGGGGGRGGAGGAAGAAGPVAPRRRASIPGAWLPRHVRSALGPELLRVLQPGERVSFVVPTALWASPHAILVVSDRRLLWLLDDAVTHRVRSLRFPAVEGVSSRLSWPLRRSAVLRVHARDGRRFDFADLRPPTAAAIARHVAAAA